MQRVRVNGALGHVRLTGGACVGKRGAGQMLQQPDVGIQPARRTTDINDWERVYMFLADIANPSSNAARNSLIRMGLVR